MKNNSPHNFKSLLNRISKLEAQIQSLEEINTKYRKNISQSEKIKTEFLAQMSHELRTPIHVILSAVELLREDHIDEKDKGVNDVLGIITSAGKRIHRTIELILNLTDLQAGTYSYQPCEFDLLLDLKETLYRSLKEAAAEKELEFVWKSETGDTKVTADIYSVMQIFLHLIENAIKFTNFGKVEVILSRNRKGELIVNIHDTGIGISKDFMPYLFKPFMQEDSGYARRYEGNGLGLAVVKKFCTINKIKIKVKSEKGVGSRFIVIFPNLITF